MPELIIYQEPVALNREQHRTLKLKPQLDGLGFAKNATCIPLAAVEFPEASREYPIVFIRGADGRCLPVALLGATENLYLTDDNRWDARYVPAFIRRYPFVLAEVPGSDQLPVCIDMAWPGFGEEEGEPLFSAEGEPTPLLQGAMVFLQDYHRQLKVTQTMTVLLEELGLLKEMNACIAPEGVEPITLQGFSIVDEQLLNQLPASQFLRFREGGFLGWVYAHLMSVAGFSRLMERIVKKTQKRVEYAGDRAKQNRTVRTKGSTQ